MKFLDKFNIKRCPWSAWGYFIMGFALGFLYFVFMYGIKALNVTYDAF
ncbi:MAG: hypothetical protein IKM28_01070 [Lachnospiraceae bacterium]|nr:hypothetical protein [Lachnospiraceae bacterium]